MVLGRLLDAIDSVPLRDDRLRLALQIWGEAIVNPRVGGFVRRAIDGLRGRMAAELLVPDPDATARVLVALVQGMVVQRDMYGQDFDAKLFRAEALALVSQPGATSRQKG